MAASETLLSIARRLQRKPSHSQISLLLRSSPSLSTLPIRNPGFSNRSLSFLSPKTPGLKPSNPSSISSFIGLHRSLSSSSSSPSEPQPQTETVDSARNPSPSPTIKPISYAVKPADPSSSDEIPPPSPPPLPPRRQRETGGAVFRRPEAAAEQATGVEPRTWTREDIRYVKDLPSITPVSYPTRVAPLPEDKVSASPDEEAPKEEDEQLERERRRIEAEARLRRSIRTTEEEKIPFPTLLKTEKKMQKVVLDLQEAIREVKVSMRFAYMHFASRTLIISYEIRIDCLLSCVWFLIFMGMFVCIIIHRN